MYLSKFCMAVSELDAWSVFLYGLIQIPWQVLVATFIKLFWEYMYCKSGNLVAIASSKYNLHNLFLYWAKGVSVCNLTGLLHYKYLTFNFSALFIVTCLLITSALPLSYLEWNVNHFRAIHPSQLVSVGQ